MKRSILSLNKDETIEVLGGMSLQQIKDNLVNLPSNLHLEKIVEYLPTRESWNYMGEIAAIIAANAAVALTSYGMVKMLSGKGGASFWSPHKKKG